MHKFGFAVLVALAVPAQASEWEFVANPYFMVPSSSGKFGVGPFETNVSASPADVFSRLNWGFMGALEANNGEWGFNLDITYLSIDITDDDRRRVSVDGHQAAVTGILLKRIHPYAWVYAGARRSDMGVRLACAANCNLPVTLPGGATSFDSRRNQRWVEALVGFRATLPFNDRFDLTMNADIGGFGVGSEVSINAWPQLGWRVSEGTKAVLGYRLIYVKHESEDDGRRFLYDVLTFGPTIGLEFRF